VIVVYKQFIQSLVLTVTESISDRLHSSIMFMCALGVYSSSI